MPHLTFCRKAMGCREDCPCRDECSEKMTCQHPELWEEEKSEPVPNVD